MAGIEGIRACVFDAYGTLFDFGSAVTRSSELPAEKRAVLAAIWRDKQIQYALLRSLQGRHADFEQVTADALDYAMEAAGVDGAAHRQTLLELYRTVSAYPEVPPVLSTLKARGFTTAILSNGTPSMLSAAVNHAGLGPAIDHVFSVEAVGVYKPAPAVYRLPVEQLGIPANAVCFVSSNGWDAYGAAAYGFHVVWCNRHGHPAERLPGRPNALIRSLSELPPLLACGNRRPE